MSNETVIVEQVVQQVEVRSLGEQGPVGPPGPVGPQGPTGLGGDLGAYLSAVDTTDQPIVEAGTPQQLRIGTLVENKSITLESPGRIVFNDPGVYSFTFSIQFTNYENNVVNRASVWLKYQGNNYPNSTSHFDVPAFRNQKPGELVGTVNFVATAVGDGDWVEIWWEGSSTNLRAETIESPNGIPDAPSVILTVTQVMYTQIPDVTLAALSDVEITDPQDGDVLVYSSGKWVNQQL
jgi:hypothetical protein